MFTFARSYMLLALKIVLAIVGLVALLLWPDMDKNGRITEEDKRSGRRYGKALVGFTITLLIFLISETTS